MTAKQRLKLQGRRGLAQGVTSGRGVAKAALDAARYYEESK
jgi:hypothetical protein